MIVFRRPPRGTHQQSRRVLPRLFRVDDKGKCTFSSMCDPTALLDLVPGEGLLKRPSMDYNEYTYCYGGGRGGWHFFARCSFRGITGRPAGGTSFAVRASERASEHLAKRTRFSIVRVSIVCGPSGMRSWRAAVNSSRLTYTANIVNGAQLKLN